MVIVRKGGFVRGTFTALFLCMVLLGCKEEEISAEQVSVEPTPMSMPVPAAIQEASGITDSKRNPGSLWVHEDGGNPTQLYLLTHDGASVNTVYLKGVANRDWEDIALSGEYLYLADIGDNNGQYDSNIIYKFKEPEAATDTVAACERIRFRYPDGAHDAEAFLVDHNSKHIYIITKRDSNSRIYRISYPVSTNDTNTAELVGTLPYNGVVSAALSADGKKVILKTYTGLYFYKRAGNEPLEQTLQKNHTSLPYTLEPQGEAVSFSVEGNGYFTLSEKAFSSQVKLHFYKMK